MPWSRAELCYCNNVHPGTTLSEVLNALRQHTSPVRQRRGLDSMGAGLWLANDVAQSLAREPTSRRGFWDVLGECGLEIATLNAFPYGNFHSDVVKDRVYRPNWADDERLRYTLALARILSEQPGPADKTLTLSTLPLGYRAHWDAPQHAQAIHKLLQLTVALARLEVDTGVHIQVCLEMEPDCVLERTDELITFFQHELLPAAEHAGMQAEQVLRYLACCFDCCHQAVMFEDITASLQAITDAGIGIGKIQISNAIEAQITEAAQLQSLLDNFAEPKFLHQVLIQHGHVTHRLGDLQDAGAREVLEGLWRVHFHIPIDRAALPWPGLASTQPAILACLDFLQSRPDLHPTLEIETYSWLEFLAPDQRAHFNLAEGIACEFRWLEAELNQRKMRI